MTTRSRANVTRDSGVTLLWLESASTGTASRLHLDGTIERLNAAGIPIHSIISSQAEPRTKSVLERLTRLSRLLVRGILASRRRGVLFARFHPFLLPVLIAWRLRGGITIVSVQGALDHAVMDGVPLARLWALLNLRTLKSADGVVTVTDGLGEVIRGAIAPDTPLAVIPNGVPTGAVPLGERADPGYEYAIFVGNLASWQGIDRMLAAVDDTQWPRDLRLVVIGDGSGEAAVKDHGNPLVSYLGRLPYEVAQAWLAGAVVSLSFQDPESDAARGGYRPFKVMEAAALGVPSIVSDARGLPELAAELGSCLVCPYDDVSALAETVASIHGDAELRRSLSRAGRTNIDRFDWTVESPRLALFIDELVAKSATDSKRAAPSAPSM